MAPDFGKYRLHELEGSLAGIRFEDSETDPGWGLKVEALKDSKVLESQEYEKSECLGSVVARWAGVEFIKATKPE